MNRRSKGITLLLIFFFGGIGIHRFYLGHWVSGLLYFFFCWTFIPAILAFCEFFFFLFMTQEKFDQRYNQQLAVVIGQYAPPGQ